MNMQSLFRGRKQWRCFHCDDVFYSAKLAREHFGADCSQVPSCKLASHEGHLITYIRKLEDELAQYRAEDSHVMRAMWSLEADQRQKLARAEEDGYGKGVRDMRAEADAAIRKCPSLDENGYICEKSAALAVLNEGMVAETRRTNSSESPPPAVFSDPT